jgi:hypothetical protein
MTQPREEVVRALLEEFWSSRWEVIERFADDCLLEDPLLPEPVRGKGAVLETFKLCHAWADLRPELRSVCASGRHAAAEFVVRGRITNAVEGIPEAAVGADFAFGETDVFEFDEAGLVARMSIYADVVGFNRQLEEAAARGTGVSA